MLYLNYKKIYYKLLENDVNEKEILFYFDLYSKYKNLFDNHKVFIFEELKTCNKNSFNKFKEKVDNILKENRKNKIIKLIKNKDEKTLQLINILSEYGYDEKILKNTINENMFKDYGINELNKSLEAILKSIEEEWNPKSLIEKAIKHNVKINILDENKLILKIEKFNQSYLFGVQKWCSSRNEKDFLKYTVRNYDIYQLNFVYNFNLPKNNDKSICAVISDKNDNIIEVYDKQNVLLNKINYYFNKIKMDDNYYNNVYKNLNKYQKFKVDIKNKKFDIAKKDFPEYFQEELKKLIKSEYKTLLSLNIDDYIKQLTKNNKKEIINRDFYLEILNKLFNEKEINLSNLFIKSKEIKNIIKIKQKEKKEKEEDFYYNLLTDIESIFIKKYDTIIIELLKNISEDKKKILLDFDYENFNKYIHIIEKKGIFNVFNFTRKNK